MSSVLQLVKTPISERNVISAPRGPTVFTLSVLDPCKKSKRKITRPDYREVSLRRCNAILTMVHDNTQLSLSKNFDSTHVIPVRPSRCCSKMSDGVSPKISVKHAVGPESHNLLAYLLIHPDVTAEAGAGRDETDRVRTRVYGSSPNPGG